MKTFTILQAARRFDSRGYNDIGDHFHRVADVVEIVLELAGIEHELTPPDDSGERRFTGAATEPSAFPKFAAWQRGGQIECGTYGDGISLRGYLAARCLQGMLANPEFEPVKNPGERSEDAFARRACDYADALLSRLASARTGGAQ